MEIKKCPRWENYGMGEDGRFYSYRKGEWHPLKSSRNISLHRDGTMICVTRWKLAYCIQNQIAPDDIDGRKFLISRYGQIYTTSDRSVNVNRIRRQKDVVGAIEKLKATRDFSQLCIDFLEGKGCEVVNVLHDMRGTLDLYLKRYSLIEEMRTDSIMEAEEQFFDAVRMARVSNPLNWMKGRSRGILFDKMKHFKRIQDYDKFRNQEDIPY